MTDNKQYLFETAPVGKSVAALVVPAVISQIISILYNMADTFFVGQLNDPVQVAAVSLVAPMMLVLTALANLFGIGGAAMASRFLGAGDTENAKRASVFGIYTALFVGVLASVISLFFDVPLLRLFGSSDIALRYTRSYYFWVFTLGAVPMLMSLVLSHFVRADGAAKLSGWVLSAGGILNLLLDPLFIFGFGMGVTGAAVATFLSNVMTLVIFLGYLYRKRETTIICVAPRSYTLRREVSLQVLGTGLPSMLQTLLASLSNLVLNNLAGLYGETVIASFGIAKKLDQIPMSITIGIAQGIVPFLGFNYAAGNKPRANAALRLALIYAIGFSLLCVALYELFAGTFVRLFIQDAEAVAYGKYFLRVMCISTPLMAVGFVMITVFQSAGFHRAGVVLSVLRKGAVDIPVMLIANWIVPLFGLPFAQPAAEGITMIVAIILFRKHLGRRKA